MSLQRHPEELIEWNIYPQTRVQKDNFKQLRPQMMVDVEETEDLWHALNVLKRCHDSFFFSGYNLVSAWSILYRFIIESSHIDLSV